MIYDVFYYCAATGENVPSDAPIAIDRADVCTKAFEVLDGADDFFGIIDRNDTTLQVATHDDLFWVEVPDPGLGGSYKAFLDAHTLRRLLENLPETFGPDTIPDATFEDW